MVELDQEQAQVLTQKLVTHYDDFAQMVSECVFVLEGMSSIAVQEELAHEDICAGFRLQSAGLHERMLVLKANLRDAIDHSKQLSLSG